MPISLLLVVRFPWEINDYFYTHKRIRQLPPHQLGPASPITKSNLCYYFVKHHPCVSSSLRSWTSPLSKSYDPEGRTGEGLQCLEIWFTCSGNLCGNHVVLKEITWCWRKSRGANLLLVTRLLNSANKHFTLKVGQTVPPWTTNSAILSFELYYYFIRMVFCLYTCLCSACAQCSQRPKHVSGSPGNGVTDGH